MILSFRHEKSAYPFGKRLLYSFVCGIINAGQIWSVSEGGLPPSIERGWTYGLHNHYFNFDFTIDYFHKKVAALLPEYAATFLSN